MSCRVSRDDVERLDDLAREAGCSRSEYIRRILKLPVAMQTETAASLRTSTGARELEAAGDHGGRSPERAARSSSDYTPGSNICDDTDRRAVLVLTDVPIRKLCVAIDRWGTNYNQAVRALNALVKRLQGIKRVDEADAREIVYLLQVCARGNESAKKGIDAVAEEARELIGAARIDMRQRRCQQRREDGSACCRDDDGGAE